LNILISYDLHNIEDGDSLENFLRKKFPNCWHGLAGTWIVISTLSPAQIKDSVMSFLKSDQGLLVMDVSGSYVSWGGFDVERSSWLKKMCI